MPTINKGSDYFGVLTYTGDGAASKTVVDTSAVSFQPDFVWVKGRSGATDHALYDAVRGTTKDLVSNSTAAETTQSTGLTSFVNGGFTIGNLAKLNTSGATYTAWCWKANGAGSSNTSGSITSTVSVNTTAGFSIVTYTGNGTSTQTVGHGLGVAPAMIIIKARSAAFQGGWFVYHKSLTSGYNLRLELTDAQFALSGTSNGGIGSSPSINTFTLANGSSTNSNVNQSSQTYVAYCWAEIAGFSKFTSFVGNGSTDGTFVYLGFRPKYILIKGTNVTQWIVEDASRSPNNVSTIALFPNLSDAEQTNRSYIDFLSNGFKLRDSNADSNASGVTYIVAAWAENPFKNSNAR